MVTTHLHKIAISAARCGRMDCRGIAELEYWLYSLFISNIENLFTY